ncbi:MAG TPA: adenylate/guanylate cyclase domain-containing protein [bacterium]|nr:adenylate/guanylate cyclase domain-containing protein [bacterium]
MTCATCGKENPGNARFCMFCAARLSQACSGCGADNPLGTDYCLTCGASLAVVESAERRVVSVVFADIVGSTSLASRMDPEPVRGILGEFFSAMREEVSRYGGSVEKFVGDAILAVFGLPQAHEDDPQRAVRCAVAMQRRMASLRTKIGDVHIRIGIATGEVIADPKAAPTGEFMATGETVNLAARLQQHAPPDAIVVDDRTRAATNSFTRYKPLPSPSEGDFADRPRWLVSGVADGEGMKRLRAPLLGRTDEVNLLLALYRRTIEDRRHHLVALLGPAGIGKTRLAQEVLDSVSRGRTSPTIWRGRCPAYGDGLTFWPLAEMLKQECHIVETDTPTIVAEKLFAVVHRVCPPLFGPDDSRAIAAGLGVVLGLESVERRVSLPDPREGDDSGSASTTLFQSLRAFLKAKATSKPLILLFEDLHWAEETLLDLLEQLATQGVDAPLFMLCLARPELFERRPAWGQRVRNYTTISLPPLSTEQSHQLITELLKGEAIPADVRRRILAKTEGNAFFIGETLRMLIDNRNLAREAGGVWRWTGDPGDIRMPDTVHGMILSRIDLLPVLEKRVVQDASVAGRIFWLGSVTAMGLQAAETLAALERLQERDLVEEHSGSTVAGEREFAFTHALIPEVAYATLSKAARSAKHLRFAGWLEGVAQHGDEFLEVLAHHYEDAWRYRFETGEDAQDTARRAVGIIRKASARAKARWTLPESRRLCDRALMILQMAALDTDVPLLLELLIDRSEVVKWLDAPDVVLEDTQRVIDLAAPAGRQDLLARAWLNRAFAADDRGRLHDAADALQRAETLFRSLGDRHGEAETLEMLGFITEDLRGKLTAAREAYRRALDLYREIGNAQGVARTTVRLGRCHVNAGELYRAERVLVDALDLAKHSNERISEAGAVLGLAIVAHLGGQAELASRRYRDAIAIHHELGDLMGAASAHRHLGMHHLRMGAIDDAETALQKARALRAEHGARSESAVILRGLAEVSLARGDLVRAAEYAEHAFKVVPDFDQLAKATHRVTLARIRASQNREAQAETLFQASLRFLESSEYVVDFALSLVKYGEALLLLKRPDRARPPLERARGLFADMGSTFFVREIDARLDARVPSGGD